MKISSTELAQKILLEEKRPLSATQIWEIAVTKGYNKDLSLSGKTPWASVSAQLYVDVRDNKDTKLSTIGSRPKLFILKENQTSIPENYIETQPVIEKKLGFLEKQLHPFLVHFGLFRLEAYLKTINHSKSTKKEYGEWVHPDVVGCYYPYSDWSPEVSEVNSLMGNSSIKIYSFEVKRELSFSNIRESFFQAVSNSSWAHEGYLVAANIDEDLDFRNEIERLSSSFGIGIIHLDIEDPDSSKTIFPARIKDNLDWETINKLSKINKDFSEFICRIRTDIKSREPRKEWYDKVYESEYLIENIK